MANNLLINQKELSHFDGLDKCTEINMKNQSDSHSKRLKMVDLIMLEYKFALKSLVSHSFIWLSNHLVNFIAIIETAVYLLRRYTTTTPNSSVQQSFDLN